MIPRIAIGVGSAVLMAGLCFAAAAPGSVRAPALVVPAEVYEVRHTGDGSVRWMRLDGSIPGGPLPVEDGVMLTERGGTMDLRVADDVVPGPISSGTVLFSAVRPDQEAIAEARGAESAAADAESQALASGGRPGIVAAALAQVEVARAALAQAEATELRATEAAEQGAMPELEAELARLEVNVRRAALRAARMDVESAQRLPWEAEQAAADARAAAAIAWADAADARARGPALTAPFDGVLRHPGGDVLARVESSDTTWLQVRVPERDRGAWQAGAAVDFVTTDGTFQAAGTIQRVDTTAHPTESVPTIWASVSLAQVAPAGATGIARTTREGWLPW